MKSKPTVAVVGLGVMGLAAMWSCVQRGMSVVGYERFGVGHPYGASNGETRLYRRAYAEGGLYLDLLERSRRFWGDLEQGLSRPLFNPTAFATLGLADDVLVAATANVAREFDMNHRVVDAAEWNQIAPQCPIDDDEIGVIDDEAGLITVPTSLVAMLERAVAQGAKAYQWCAITAIDETDAGVTIQSDRGTDTFDLAIVTAGAWVDDVAPGLPVTTRRVQETWHPTLSNAFTVADFPTLIRTPNRLRGFSVRPSLDGSLVRFGVMDGTYPEQALPGFEYEVSADRVQLHAEHLERVLAEVHPVARTSRAYPESFTPDGRPLIGHAPGRERVFIVAGASAHGYKLAPAFGELVAKCVAGEQLDEPYRSAFAPDRKIDLESVGVVIGQMAPLTPPTA